MSRLFKGEEKDKYLRSRVLSFKTMSSIVFSKVGGLTDVNINSSGRAMIIYKSIDRISNELKVYGRSATQSGFVGSITDMISELKQYNVSPEMLENMAGEVENETLRYKLMDIAKIYNEFEKNLLMLLQRVRNLGIHLIIATQRPSAQIVTGALKAVIPFRVSFRLPSHTDSQTILDMPGAENLLGKGDMLMVTESDTKRMQGLYISEDELEEFLNKL